MQVQIIISTQEYAGEFVIFRKSQAARMQARSTRKEASSTQARQNADTSTYLSNSRYYTEDKNVSICQCMPVSVRNKCHMH